MGVINMKNWITEKIFNEEAGHCDYWDWEFESINFQWLPKRGVWHIRYYDYSGIFNGKIEGRELTRCVCNDGQFTHYMVEGTKPDLKRIPLQCPTCEPEPTPAPAPTMCFVSDDRRWDNSHAGSGMFIHDSNCNHIQWRHNGMYFMEKNIPITKEGMDEIAWNLLADMAYENNWNYDIPEGVDTKQLHWTEWQQYFNLEKAKRNATLDVMHYANCNCMKEHRERIKKELGEN
jgi:hypothetical protein